MVRVVAEQVGAAVLDVDVLLLRDGLVIGDDGAAERRVLVAGLGEAAAAVAQPEEVPAGYVAEGGGGRLDGAVGELEREVLGRLAGGGLGDGRVEEVVGCAGEGLHEEARGAGEGVHLRFYAEVPVGVVFEDEGGGEALLDDPAANQPLRGPELWKWRIGFGDHDRRHSHSSNIHMRSPGAQSALVKVCLLATRRKHLLVDFCDAVHVLDLQACESCC